MRVLVKVEAVCCQLFGSSCTPKPTRIAEKFQRGETPHILGSDIAGTIAEIGDTARGVTVGDRVVLAPCIPCGVCSDCNTGTENLCDTQELIGFQTDGGYAEYVKAPARNAIQMPDARSYAIVMPLQCRLRISRHGTCL